MMKKEQLEDLMLVAVRASLMAGEEILDVYYSNFAIRHKKDKSPLTKADKKAHKTISEYLKETEYPVLSEEGRDIPFEERKNWKQFWLVDPLDGTKEFIKRNGEFTVNIALIEDGYPVMGVIYVPEKEKLFLGIKEMGAYSIQSPGSTQTMDKLLKGALKLPVKGKKEKFTIVASRSHMSQETEDFINKLRDKHGEVEIASMGSSLKLCLVAEGKADAYPRFAPTMEWDTGAGQAIAEAAGKTVVNWESQKRLAYNKENLKNPWFLVS